MNNFYSYKTKRTLKVHILERIHHGSALEGSDPHELAGRFEGVSELTLFKSYEIGLWRI